MSTSHRNIFNKNVFKLKNFPQKKKNQDNLFNINYLKIIELL